MTDEQKLKFSFFTEGRFFYKAQVFNFKIDGLKPKVNVGLTRDVLIPIYSLIKKHFSFLDLEEDSPNELLNYKGFKGSGNQEDIFVIEGAIQEAHDPTKDEKNSIKLGKSLVTTFNRYQDGNIVYDLSWRKNVEDSSFDNVSIEEVLVGVAVSITKFRFALEGYAKTGFSYRLFNVPSRVFDFEIAMDDSFRINFKLEKGTSSDFLLFISELFSLIVEVFGLEEDIAKQLEGIDMKLQTRLG